MEVGVGSGGEVESRGGGWGGGGGWGCGGGVESSGGSVEVREWRWVCGVEVGSGKRSIVRS